MERLEPRVLLDAGVAFDLSWAVAVGADGSAIANDMAVDASGNVHITGSFRGTVDFDPGPGVFNLISAGNADIFVAKLASSGGLLWARAMGGPGSDQANGIAVDSSGNVYTAGRFEGVADFDPGLGSYGLTSAGGGDAFVSKLDSSGNFGWASAMAGWNDPWGGSDDGAFDVAVDASGNVYTTGKITYTIYISPPPPGPGQIARPGYHVADPGAFLAKYGPSGDLAWSIRPGMSNSLATDTSGNLHIAGSGGVAISKLDSSGNALWEATIDGDSSQAAGGIALDDSGNVYVTGSFRGTIDFDPGPGVFELTGPSTQDSSDGFVLKLDASGGFVWAVAMASGGSPSSARGEGVAVDRWGDVCTTGRFSDTVDFDPGPGTFELTSTGIEDIFVSKLDSTGSFLWAGAMAGAGASDTGHGENLAVDSSDNVYATGYFAGTTDFDPGPGTFNLAVPVDSFFALRLSPRPPAIAGAVWNDLDGDGSRDAGETGIDGATVTLFRDDGDSVFEPGGADVQLASRLTASGGTYSFTDLLPGQYWVDVDEGAPLLAGFALTSGAESLLARLGRGGQVSSADFGYQSVQVTLQADDPDGGEAGRDTGTFRITRTGPTRSALTVHFAISGSATSGADYQGVVTPVVIPAGRSSASVVVQPIDDDQVEGEETVVLALVGDPAYHVGAPDTATVTIAEDDALPIAIDDLQVAEGNTGATTDAMFTLTLAEYPLVPVRVTYSTAAGTATEGVDYQRAGGTITFTPGQALTRTISVSVAGDDDLEHRETFFVNLTNDLGAPIADAQAQGTILDDDGILIHFGGKTAARYTDATGDEISVQLRGPGIGTVCLPAADGADAFDIVLDDTDAKSSLSIATGGRGTETTVGDILVNGSLNALDAKTTDLLGDLTVTGSLKKLQLDDVADGHTIRIGAAASAKAAVTVVFDEVSDLVIESGTPIKSLVATEWLDADGTPDSIAAAWLGKLTTKGRKANVKKGISGIAGDFQAGLNLHGSGAPKRTLGSAKIVGQLGAGTWRVTGSAGNIAAGSVAADWAANLTGPVGTLAVKGDAGGRLSAESIKGVKIAGDLTDARILAGAYLGADSALGGTGDDADTFGPGLIGSVKVGGQVVGSIVAAALDPLNGAFNDGADLIVDSSSALKSVSIGGPVSGDSLIASGVLPRSAKINGQSVDPAQSALFLDAFGANFAGVGVAGVADELGRVTLEVNGQEVTFELTDEVTGSPIPGLSLGVGMDPNHPWQAVAVVADPREHIPLQILTLHGPQSAGPLQALAGPETLEVPVRGGSGNIAQGVLHALQTGVLDSVVQNLPEPEGNSAFVKALYNAFEGLATSEKVPKPGLLGGFLRVSTQKMDIQAAEAKAEADGKKAVAEDLLGLRLPGPSIVPNTAVTGLNMVAIGLYERIGATDIIYHKIQLPGAVVVVPVPVFTNGIDQAEAAALFDPSQRVDLSVGQPQGAPVAGGSYELISKDPLALAIVGVLDTQGNADIPVPTGDYDYRITVPGLEPSTGSLTVGDGDYPLDVTVAEPLVASLELVSEPGLTGFLANTTKVQFTVIARDAEGNVVDMKQWQDAGYRLTFDHNEGVVDVVDFDPAKGVLTVRSGPGAARVWARLTSPNGVTIATGPKLIGSSGQKFGQPPPAPGITVAPTSGLVTTEGRGTATFTVKLNTPPTADVTIAVFSSDTTEGKALDLLMFTPLNWFAPQTVTVTGVDDAIVDGDVEYTIITRPAVSLDLDYNGVDPPDVHVTNRDDEAAIIVAPTSGLETTEAGGKATFTVRLNGEPTANVTINLSSSDTTEGTVRKSSLTFTPSNWNVPHTVEITGKNDSVLDGDIAYTIITAPAVSQDPRYNGLNPEDVSVTNRDDDKAKTYTAKRGQVAVNIVGNGYVYDDAYGKIDTRIGDHVGSYHGTEVFNLIASSSAQWYVNGSRFTAFSGVRGSNTWWTVFPRSNGLTYTLVFP